MNEWLQTTRYVDIWRFTDALVTELVKPEYRKLQDLIDRLVLANGELLGKRFPAFTQNGLIYKHSSMSMQHPGTAWRPALCFSLSKQFQEYKKEEDQLAHERSVMRQVLTLLYQNTVGMQDLRDMTPEYLVRFVPEFQGIPRCYEELFLVADNERLMRQFKKTENLFKLHAASHLLY